jgi:hypothetical protein
MDAATKRLIEAAQIVVRDYKTGDLTETRFAVARMADELDKIKEGQE